MDSIYYLVIAAVLGLIILLFRSGKRTGDALPKPASEGKAGSGTNDARKAEAPPQDTRLPADPRGKEVDVPSEPSSKSALPAPLPEREVDVAGLRKGLGRARGEDGLFGRLRALFSGKTTMDDALAEAIEEVLLSADVGTATTAALVQELKTSLAGADLQDEDKVWSQLRKIATRMLDMDGQARGLQLKAKPTVVLLVGVNGAGKTTTIGKLATQLQAAGKTCVLAAGDTFRAAAVQQLIVWGQRIGCEVVRGKDGADPASVVFEAIKKAQETGADIVLADSAGRLHTKSNLMSEMQKIQRTLGKAMDGAPHETLLVLDGTTGQNALAQAKEFQDALGLTGVVLTKLDGTAKGGFILAISDGLKLPVRYVGVGERPNDLHEFSAGSFVEALLGRDE